MCNQKIINYNWQFGQEVIDVMVYLAELYICSFSGIDNYNIILKLFIDKFLLKILLKKNGFKKRVHINYR